MTPNEYLGGIATLAHDHEAEITMMNTFGDGRTKVDLLMPLRELMRNFFDELKSVTSGYASIAYDFAEMRDADVTRLDILLAGDSVPAFTRVISRRRALEEAEESVEKLHEIMPRQQFEMKVQGYALGRIIASKTIKAFRKDVLTKGSKSVGAGDRTRKMKLLEKQKEGKKRMQQTGRVHIPHEVFLKMMKK
jgi:GTP-binding protein LepA